MQCLQCQADNDAELRFCETCGTALARVCPSCGHQLKPQARFCGKCGASLSTAPPPSAVPAVTSAAAADGERRQLTALFCDLVGSTEIASQLDPEDWHRLSKEYQQTAAAAVRRFGGHVDKFLGDGLVCFFGVPQAQEDDAERAVRAGLAIVDAVQALNERLHSSPLPLPDVATEEETRIPSAANTSANGGGLGRRPVLRVRVGMHTGAAVVAHGGGESKDVFGDTPNIAARVQSVAEPDTVVVSAATQRLVAGLFVVEERGPQHLKGVREPVVLYRVVQSSGVRSRLDASAGRHTPFVGRQTELGVLRDAWERVVEGLGQTVLVQGEAGLGKSRLCYELRQQLTGEPHTWLECRCSPYTAGTAFRPVIELVEQALAFQPADTPAEKLRKLSSGLAHGGFAANEALPLLAEWLELPESAGYTPLQMSPDLKRRKTLETLAVWNLRLGELQPLVLLVEDLHWCDPSSLELLGRLVAQSATARVLLVGTARPEFTRPWPVRSNLQTLTLGRLTKRQTREMVQRIITQRHMVRHSRGSVNPSGGPGGPQPDWTPASARVTEPKWSETMIAALITRADGIPLFAEELTQAVLEAGGDAAVAAIPATLQDSLLARLDRLSTAKEVAQRAAVLGREFSYTLLAATAGLDQGALQQGLARLVEAELLFVRGVPPEATYTFKHALVQEAAYESLLKRTRQELHGRVVDALLARFPEHAAAEPEVVARHAEVAGRIDEAITSYQRAGEQAQTRSAHEEAIRHLRRAIALVATPPEGLERNAREVSLQLAVAASLVAVRGYAHAETEAAYERARQLCEAIGDPVRLGIALLGLGSAYANRGEVERGYPLTARGLAIGEERGIEELVLYGHVITAFAEQNEGKFASSLAHCEAVFNLYDPQRHGALAFILNGEAGVVARDYAALNLWLLGRPEQALVRAGEAVERGRRVGQPFSLTHALTYATLLDWLRHDTARQQERVAEVIALSEAHGFPLFLGLGRAVHAGARVESGEPGAIADLLAGLALVAETGSQAGAPALFAMLGEAYMAVGQFPEALGAVETGLAVAAQTGQFAWDADLHRLQGEIVLKAVDSPLPALSPVEGPRVERGKTAEECFHRALEIARAQEAKSFELRAATSLARLWRDQGKPGAARDLLAPVYAWFTEGFDTRDLIDAKALLQQL